MPSQIRGVIPAVVTLLTQAKKPLTSGQSSAESGKWRETIALRLDYCCGLMVHLATELS